MTERPIIFSGPMVRAILAGKKTQTRRIVKNVFSMCTSYGELDAINDVDGHPARLDIAPDNWEICPYGVARDTLWVRETFANMEYECNAPTWTYRADTPSTNVEGWALPPGVKWKPSIFMPRAASRITLRVTSVRVERLQEISNEDAEAEGVKCDLSAWGFRDHFQGLWDSLNFERAPWSSNPWVWVITFERVE